MYVHATRMKDYLNEYLQEDEAQTVRHSRKGDIAEVTKQMGFSVETTGLAWKLGVYGRQP